VSASSRHLCLFDLDGTLIVEDSNALFGAFLARIGWVDGVAFARCQQQFHDQYSAGQLDLSAYIDFTTAPWRSRSWSQALAARARFMTEDMAHRLQPQALALVRRHLDRGDLVALVTATNEFVTAPIAAAFGVSHLLGVQLERDAEGHCTGAICGTPTFREGKVTRVGEWLAGLGRDWADFDTITVYSDSSNDLPLLECATHPVATNPVPALEATARERGWRILQLLT